MNKKFPTLAMAGVVGLAALTAAPPPAQAQWWIAPAIVGGVILGAGIGSAVANPYNQGYAYGPAYGYAYASGCACAPAYAYAPNYAYAPAYAYVPGYAYAPAGYAYGPNIPYVRARNYYARPRYGGAWRQRYYR